MSSPRRGCRWMTRIRCCTILVGNDGPWAWFTEKAASRFRIWTVPRRRCPTPPTGSAAGGPRPIKATTILSIVKRNEPSATAASRRSSLRTLAVTESMGAISDRTLEHLAPSDRMITMTRRRLIEAARALRDHGTVPPLVDDPHVSSVARSGDLIAPAGLSWLEAYEQTLGRALHPEFSQAAE